MIREMASKAKPGKVVRQQAAKTVVKPTVAAKDPLLLVCLQDPFAPGTWLHYEDALVPCDDGKAGHVWRVRAGFELLAPRFLEGQATASAVTMIWKAIAQAAPDGNAQWSGPVRLETSAVQPLRVTVRPNTDGKMDLSLDYGAVRAPGTKLPFAKDNRHFELDVAFAANGKSGLTVGAVAVISTPPWSQLVAGSNAVIEGMAFESGWRRNLKDKPVPLADGAATATGSWAFAMMTRAEYADWCAARALVPHIV